MILSHSFDDQFQLKCGFKKPIILCFYRPRFSMDSNCKFSIGDIIHHLRFDYRGVIYDVDATFQGTEEWYNQMAKSKPPRDQPWYHVLVDQSATMTYVAERNLEADSSSTPIEHPLVDQYFSQFKNGKYILQLS